MLANGRPNAVTRRVSVGGVDVGGGAPVAVQSMLNVPTGDAARCLAEIEALAQAGCEIIRVAVPDASSLHAFAAVCEASPLPVVADIHFDHRLAVAAAGRGAAKLRINPGNIGSEADFDAVIEAAGAAGIPIRVGVNAGSLAPGAAARTGLSFPERLVASAEEYVRHCEARGFRDVVVSVKAHDVQTTVEAYRLCSRRLPEYPLHIGVTEAGTMLQGTVKSAIGIGSLLLGGIGDTLRVSLTEEPVQEVRVAWEILAACGIRRRRSELVSCPTCARCEVDLISIAKELEGRLGEVVRPLSIAVMGCVVNGPGEAREADVGVACGRGKGAVFSKGEVLYTVSENEICDALIAEANKMAASR